MITAAAVPNTPPYVQLAARRVAMQLALIIMLAQLADTLSTLQGIARGLTEGNPINVWVLHVGGSTGLFGAKMVIAACIAAGVARLPRRAMVVAGVASAALPLLAAMSNLRLLG